MSEVVGRKLDQAASALRRAARAAGDEGAPDLYAALFPPVPRSPKKAKRAPEQIQPQSSAST